MRFWDTSALMPLLVEETASRRLEALYRSDPEMLVWYATPAEVESAIQRRRREGSIDADSERWIRERLGDLEETWYEVQATEVVRERAIRLLRVHPLRGADAFQLGAALVVFEEHTRGNFFLAEDARLREAAEAEGFSV